MENRLKRLTNKECAVKIIQDLEKAGFSPDEMIKIIKLAKKKYKKLIKQKQHCCLEADLVYKQEISTYPDGWLVEVFQCAKCGKLHDVEVLC